MSIPADLSSPIPETRQSEAATAPGVVPHRPTLRERLAQERRVELVEAALVTFSRRGYHAASLKEIADAAGVTDALLVHYFGSKLNLLRAALEARRDMLDELSRIVDEAPDDDPAAALRYLATRWLSLLDRDGGSVVGMLIGEARYNPEVAEALAEHSRRASAPTERLLRRLAARGHLHAEYIPTAARIFQWSLTWYTFVRDITPVESFPDKDTWVEGLVATMLGGLVHDLPLTPQNTP